MAGKLSSIPADPDYFQKFWIKSNLELQLQFYECQEVSFEPFTLYYFWVTKVSLADICRASAEAYTITVITDASEKDKIT